MGTRFALNVLPASSQQNNSQCRKAESEDDIEDKAGNRRSERPRAGRQGFHQAWAGMDGISDQPSYGRDAEIQSRDEDQNSENHHNKTENLRHRKYYEQESLCPTSDTHDAMN